MAKEVGSVHVKISADTTLFEQAVERNILVMYIHAIRELAFVKLMVRGQRAAFDSDEARNIDALVAQSPEELHEIANQLERELADWPVQGGMDLG